MGEMTLFGLPEEVRFCKKCVISNQRPNSVSEYSHVQNSVKETIRFDSEGVCDACRIAEAKESTDWKERERELSDLCDAHRSRDGGYDCIVPGSGGKDSFYASHRLKYQFGMHPLTVTWAPHIYTEWGLRNFQRWVEHAPNYTCTPGRRVHRLLTRLAVENLFHPFQPFIIGQKSLAPKLAVLHNIPLVFYGENEAEYGNPAHTFTAQRDSSFHTSDDIILSGVHRSELLARYGLSNSDLSPYLPASTEALKAKKVEVHYLGYYLKWHPQSAYYYAVERGGFEPSPFRTIGTYSTYNSIDDVMDHAHYFCTMIKFGIGRATYDAAQEIRSGDITREEGVALVKRFDGEWFASVEKQIMDYLSVPGFPKMDKESFLILANKFRSNHLWRQDEKGEWHQKHTVWQTDSGQR